MSKIKKAIALAITVLFLIGVSVQSFSAITLYVDGSYTYADVDLYNVALYDYDDSSPALVIPSKFEGRKGSSVYDYAFEDDDKITSIDFSKNGNNLSAIGVKSFENCTGLSGELVFPRSLRTMGLGAFQGCTGINTVSLNIGIKDIPAQCFNRCSSLSTVYLPSNLETIGNLAFANCAYLDDVYIPSSVTYISDSAFMNSNYVCLHVSYNSYAHKYALENNINYTLLDGVKLGDANGDGSVNINDVTTIQRHLAELETLEGIYLHAADANQDGTVDISDATIIQMYLAEYEMEYPIGEVMTQ